MRPLIIIVTLLISTATFGQNPLDKRVSEDVCTCLRLIPKLTETDFLGCFQKAIQKNSDLVLRQYKTLSNDTSEEAGYKFGQELYSRISVSMVYSCIAYFKLMDTLRYSLLQGLDKDSVRNVIAQINKSDSSNWDKDFLTQRGVMYFQVSELDNALSDFDKAIKLDQYSLQSIYFKAWTLELKGDFDQAFSLYNSLALLTKKNDFNIFAAIAKQKKNGL